MKNVPNATQLIGIAALILSAKAQAQITSPSQATEGVSDSGAERLSQEQKMVGFSPAKAVHTLETLAYSGASHFNENGETLIEASKIPHVIRAATSESLETKILPATRPGFVKVKFSDALVQGKTMNQVEANRLKNITDYFKLKCHGGGVVN